MLNGNVHISKLGETISVSNFVGTCKSGTQTHEVFGL
jgi:hypothetical protein